MKRWIFRIAVALLLLVSLAGAAWGLWPPRTVTIKDFLGMRPFEATVIENEELPLDWGKHRYLSTTQPGFCIVLELKDGSRIQVMTPAVDHASSFWLNGVRIAEVGKKYRFGKEQIKKIGEGR